MINTTEHNTHRQMCKHEGDCVDRATDRLKQKKKQTLMTHRSTQSRRKMQERRKHIEAEKKPGKGKDKKNTKGRNKRGGHVEEL